MIPRLGCVLVFGILLGAGCSDDTNPPGTDAGQTQMDGGGQAASLSGTLKAGAGKTVPKSARLMVIWSVSSGSPDYMYKFGEAAISGASFSLVLDKAPPAEALNSYGVGVGNFYLVDPSCSIPDGKVTDATLKACKAYGAGAGQNLLYKAKGAKGPGWAKPLPAGYSCGACIHSTGTFDSFKKMSCSTLDVEVDDLKQIEVCNWT